MAQPEAAAAASQEPLLLRHHLPPPPCYGVPVGIFQAQPCLLFPPRPRRCRPRGCPPFCQALLSFSSLLAAALLLWPAAPDVRLTRVDLHSIRVSTNRHGGVALDVAVDLNARVRNPNFFPLHAEGVTVELWYRGQRLGSVDVGGARLRGRGESRVDAMLLLQGVWVLEDTAFLLDDIARGRIHLHMAARVKGRLHLFGAAIPMQGRISCAINVDVDNQIIASQDCYAVKPKD